MKWIVRPTIEARKDAREIYRYLSREANQATGDRFLTALDKAFQQIAKAPQAGAQFPLDRPDLEVIRFRPLAPRFQKYIVFYAVRGNRVAVIRILHGARDVSSILSEDEDSGGE